MAYIHDSYALNYSPVITITGTEDNTTSLPLQAASDLPLQLSGFVYSTTLGGTAVPNAFVSVYDTSDVLVANAFTDSSGYYSITTLTAGSYQITASKSGFTAATLASVTLTTDPVEQNIVIQPYSGTDRVIYGIVTGTGSLAIGGARVDIIDSLGAVVASTLSIADGEYSVNNLSAGTYTVVTAATGYAANSSIAVVSDTTPLVNIDVALTAYTPPAEKATISGFITNASSAPIPNAWVGLYTSDTKTLIATTSTTADGYYVFTGIEPGTYVVESKAVA
ncbi:carboxypeptidase-like regulatory domain-containing protein [Oscillospiraceae bacterium PP1C4]